jgi:hypothetical protein
MLDGLTPAGFGEDRSSGRPYSFKIRESSCSKRACEGVAMEVAVAPESAIPFDASVSVPRRCRGSSHRVLERRDPKGL